MTTPSSRPAILATALTAPAALRGNCEGSAADRQASASAGKGTRGHRARPLVEAAGRKTAVVVGRPSHRLHRHRHQHHHRCRQLLWHRPLFRVSTWWGASRYIVETRAWTMLFCAPGPKNKKRFRHSAPPRATHARQPARTRSLALATRTVPATSSLARRHPLLASSAPNRG